MQNASSNQKSDYGLMALKYLAEQPGAGAQSPAAQSAGAQSAKDIAQAYQFLRRCWPRSCRLWRAPGCWCRTREPMEAMRWRGPPRRSRPLSDPGHRRAAVHHQLHHDPRSCDLAGHCTIKEPLRKVNDSIKELLSNIFISDLIETAEAALGDEGVAVARDR